MKAIDVINPTAIKYPVAIEGDKNTIPLNVTGSQLASIKGGFPLITETPVAEGGKPPVRKDFNGLFYLATDYKAFLQDGGYITFSQDVSDLIGGYPSGAILDYYTSGTNSYTKVVSLIDDNTYNFVTTPSYIDGAKWQFVDFGGANKALSNLSADGNDFINQSKAMTTGSVSDNALVYADILSRLHTSFDLSKFTVTGSPTITDNGIASGFGMSGYIFNNANDLSSALKNCDEFSINIGFTPQANTVDERYQLVFGIVENASGTGSTPILFNINKTGNKFSFKFEANPPYSISVGNSHLVQLIYNWTNLTMKVILDGVLIDTANYDLTGKFDTPKYALFGYDGGGLQWVNYGSIDLKQFEIKADGVTVFNGNKTGSDSYTIGGNTVTIPYTLTSGGAKIADYASLTDIQDVFNAGFTDEQYLSIDEDNQQFTLPQGMSVYEGIGKKANKSLSNINAAAINDIFVYNQPADTYTTLTLGASGATYTATDNGFYVLRALGSSFRMYMDNGFGVEPSSTSASINVTGVLPVRKGQSITIDYTIMNVVFFIFIKARGV